MSGQSRPPASSAERALAARHFQFFAHSAEGLLVDVTQVPRGLACRCVCPECGTALVAKQGSKVAWHFAHALPVEGRPCAETALHLAGKEVLRRLETLELPAIEYRHALLDSSGVLLTSTRETPAREVSLQGVELEVPWGARRLDALAHTSAGDIGIEIRVTHAVDEAKTAELAERGLPVLELDLRSLLRQTVTWPQLALEVRVAVARKFVCGGEACVPAEDRARMEQDVEALRARRNAQINQALAATPEDLAWAAQLAAECAISLSDPPAWLGESGWIAGSKPPSEPRRAFEVHHLVWQLALFQWLSQQQPQPRVHLDAVVRALLTALGKSDARSLHLEREALKQFLSVFEHPTLALTQSSYKWGSETLFEIVTLADEVTPTGPGNPQQACLW